MALLNHESHNGNSIVIMGPTGVGKTSVAWELAAILAWPVLELDSVQEEWFASFGLDADEEQAVQQRGGLPALLALWKPYELRSIERVMRDYPQRHIILFGGEYGIFDDDTQLERARVALAAAQRVVLLQPANHLGESLEVLARNLRSTAFVRNQPDIEIFVEGMVPLLKRQLQSESITRLATDIVVAGQSSPSEIARHIVLTMGK